MTVRIAGIVAYSRGSLTIEALDMPWARAWAMRSAQSMYEAVENYLEDPKSHFALCRYIKEAVANGPIPHHVMRKACKKILPGRQEVLGSDQRSHGHR